MSQNRDFVEPKGRKKKGCPFVASGIKVVDYKDVELLRKFITDKGKILPRRVTGISQKYQRYVTNAIKRARHVSLLPYVAE
ncbi:30S ribosomal protein S18 [Chlamydiales bacterium]|nr:30S ribosomal protein S18 [Chlamydiales bacterium]